MIWQSSPHWGLPVRTRVTGGASQSPVARARCFRRATSPSRPRVLRPSKNPPSSGSWTLWPGTSPLPSEGLDRCCTGRWKSTPAGALWRCGRLWITPLVNSTMSLAGFRLSSGAWLEPWSTPWPTTSVTGKVRALFSPEWNRASRCALGEPLCAVSLTALK